MSYYLQRVSFLNKKKITSHFLNQNQYLQRVYHLVRLKNVNTKLSPETEAQDSSERQSSSKVEEVSSEGLCLTEANTTSPLVRKSSGEGQITI